MSDGLEHRVQDLEDELDSLREDVTAARERANKALSRSIDVTTDFEESQDSDDLLSNEVTQLRSTVRNLQHELEKQASDIETWAARLVTNMLRESFENAGTDEEGNYDADVVETTSRSRRRARYVRSPPCPGQAGRVRPRRRRRGSHLDDSGDGIQGGG